MLENSIFHQDKGGTYSWPTFQIFQKHLQRILYNENSIRLL